MPVIPPFEPDLEYPTPHMPMASIAESGTVADAVARGAAEVEDQEGSYAARHRLAAEADDLGNTLGVGEHQLGQAMVARVQQAGTTDANGNIVSVGDAANGFADDAQNIRKGLLASVTDPMLQSDVATHFDDMVKRYGMRVWAEGLDREGAARDGRLQLNLANQKIQYADADTPQLRQQILTTATSEIKALQDGGFITGDRAAQHLLDFQQGADAADAMHDIATNPGLAVQKLGDPSQYPHLDPYRRAMFSMRAANGVRSANAQAQGAILGAYRDNVASYEANGTAAVPLNPAQIRAAFPNRADAMLSNLDRARRVSMAVSASTLTSPAEDETLLQQWTPKGAGFAEQQRAQGAIQKALTAKWQAVRDDPAGYVMRVAPGIRAQFAVAEKDPTKLSPAIGALDATYDQLGLPDAARHVLPLDSARNLAGAIASDPEQAPAKLKSLASQYGTAWPRVWHDVVSEGGLPAPFQAVGVLENERDGALLARWLAQAKGGDAAGLLGATAVNTIKASVRGDPGVQQLVSSLTQSGASPTQADGILTSIDDLAFAKSLFDRDPHAALDAIQSFTGQYEFMPNGGARVPRQAFPAVSANAAARLAGLGLDQVAVPGAYGRPGGPTAQEFLATLKAAPSWITAPRGDALWLMDPAGRIVRGPDGTPIAVPFAAAAAPASVPAPAPVPGL